MALDIEVSRRQIAVIALSIAEGYAAAGTHEEGGNNRGDQVEFYQRMMGGRPGDPWCADFVCTCLVKAYARANGLREDRENLLSLVKVTGAVVCTLSGSCAAIAADARARGLWRPPEFGPQALPGDLVLYDFGRTGRPGHVEFVKRCGALTVETVGGNTSSGVAGSQRDGDGVFDRARSRGAVCGFVHFG